MESNFSNTPQSYNVAGQAPLDSKLIANTLDELTGVNASKAHTYYRGMRVYCQEDNKTYEWTDQLDGKIKLLPEPYVYPDNTIYDNIDYSLKSFNFVEVLTQYSENERAEYLENEGSGVSLYNGVNQDTKNSKIASIGSDDFSISKESDGTVKINLTEDSGFLNVRELYSTSTDSNVAPAIDENVDAPLAWSSDMPQQVEGEFIWVTKSLWTLKGDRATAWSSPVRLSGGEGVKGNNSFKSLVFKRSSSAPARPTGGSYDNPIPTGWSDGIPPEDNGKPVYMSMRIFSSDGEFPQQSQWTLPRIAIDTANTDFEFTDSKLDPGTPSSPLNNAIWYNDARETSNWMAIRSISNGSNGPWQVIKTRGEKGGPGPSSRSTFTSTIFLASLEQPETPVGGDYENPVPDGWSDGIPESNGNPIWMSMRILTSDGLGSHQLSWSEPVRAIDNSVFDFEWSTSDVLSPGTPTEPANGAIWTNDKSTDTIWMAIRELSNGVPGEWAVFRIKGEKGAKGNDGVSSYVLDLSNDNTSVSTTASGAIVNPSVAFANANTKASLYLGSEELTLNDYGIVLTASPGTTYTSNIDKTEIQITGLSSDTGSILFEAYLKVEGVIDMDKKVASATFTINKVKNTAVYEIIPSTTAIKVNSDSTLSPDKVSAKILMNSGDTNSYTNSGNLTYRYLYSNNINTEDDGTLVSIGENINLSNTGNPLYLEFKYFHQTTGELVDRERIPFVRDGSDGADGEPATREETRFKKSGSWTVAPTLDNTSSNPVGWTINPPAISSGEYVWVIKAIKTATDSLIGTWSAPIPFTGNKGEKGDSIKGDPGDNGKSLFIAPLGNWDPNRVYVGTETRIEAVFYEGSWYVTRTDADSIPAGMLPTNTAYFNQAQENFEFIATGLFLAETAYINNLGVRYVQTASSGERLEIDGDSNELNFYVDGDDNPKIKLGTFSYTFGNTLGFTGPGLMVAYKAWITEQGVRSIGNEVGVYEDTLKGPGGEPISPPFKTSTASVFGRTTKVSISTQGENDNKINAGVAGTSSQPAGFGRQYGGYFDSLLIGSESLRLSKSDSLTTERSTYFYSGSTSKTVQLPNLQKVVDGWNTHSVFRAMVINTKTATITVQGNGQTFVLTGKGKYEFYWDGIEWSLFKSE